MDSEEHRLLTTLRDSQLKDNDCLLYTSQHFVLQKNGLCVFRPNLLQCWKGDALYEPQWYVTEVLEEGVPCPALEEIWAEYTKPILLEDEVLGTLTLDREMSIFEGTCKWMGKEVRISLDVEIEKKASWTRVTNVMKKLVADQETWDKSLRAMAAQKLTAQANEWLADNDQTDRDPEKDPITEDEFARRILLTEFTVSPGGRFTAWYEDDDMFWGHVITVDGTLKKGPGDADIQG